MMSVWRKYWLSALIALCALLVVPSVVVAGESPQEQVEHLRAQLDELEEDALAAGAEAEFQRANAWLEEASQLASRGARSGVEQRLRRVDHSVDLLRALIRTHDIEHSIVHQREAYENSKRQVEDLKDDIEQLERQKQERKEELKRIRERD